MYRETLQLMLHVWHVRSRNGYGVFINLCFYVSSSFSGFAGATDLSKRPFFVHHCRRFEKVNGTQPVMFVYSMVLLQWIGVTHLLLGVMCCAFVSSLFGVLFAFT